MGENHLKQLGKLYFHVKSLSTINLLVAVFFSPVFHLKFKGKQVFWKTTKTNQNTEERINKEPTHLHYFTTFQNLIGKEEKSLFFFENTAKKVLSLFGFYNKLASSER
jgi:hypothetical protein